MSTYQPYSTWQNIPYDSYIDRTVTNGNIIIFPSGKYEMDIEGVIQSYGADNSVQWQLAGEILFDWDLPTHPVGTSVKLSGVVHEDLATFALSVNQDQGTNCSFDWIVRWRRIQENRFLDPADFLLEKQKVQFPARVARLEINQKPQKHIKKIPKQLLERASKIVKKHTSKSGKDTAKKGGKNGKN